MAAYQHGNFIPGVVKTNDILNRSSEMKNDSPQNKKKSKKSVEAAEQENELNESTNKKKKKSKKDKYQEILSENSPMFSSPTVAEKELDQPRNVLVDNLLSADLFNDIPKKKKKSKKEKRDKEGTDEQVQFFINRFKRLFVNVNN